MEYTDSYRAFCERLKISRKLLDYDQVRMASELDMTRDEYVNKETGRTMVTGTDLKKINDMGMDIDKLLVNVDRNVNCQILKGKVATFNNTSEIEYVKGVVTEYMLYLCEQHLDDFTENVLKNIRILKAFDNVSSKPAGSMLKCVRDINGITDQLMISEELGISRYKYSKIENNKEYPDAMVLIRLYELYGYLPTMYLDLYTMYLDLYDVRIEMLDNIYDSMEIREQDLIIKFVDNLRQFV